MHEHIQMGFKIKKCIYNYDVSYADVKVDIPEINV